MAKKRITIEIEESLIKDAQKKGLDVAAIGEKALTKELAKILYKVL